MATFMSRLNKERAKKGAEEQFSRLAADIQSKKIARIDAETAGDIAVQEVANRGDIAVQGLRNVGTRTVAGIQERGATGRRKLAEAGATTRIGMQVGEEARQFDLGYGLEKRADVREQRAFDFDQAFLEGIAPFERESRIAGAEAETSSAKLLGRKSQQELDVIDATDAEGRRKYLSTAGMLEAQRQKFIDTGNAFIEAIGRSDLKKKMSRQDMEYLGTIFGGY